MLCSLLFFFCSGSGFFIFSSILFLFLFSTFWSHSALLCLEHAAFVLLAVANPINTCASHSGHLAPRMCGDKQGGATQSYASKNRLQTAVQAQEEIRLVSEEHAGLSGWLLVWRRSVFPVSTY
jgi:hypothetical protein